jgi:heme exporter protein A
VPLRQAGAAFTGRLVYIAHTNALKDDLSARENLQFLARLHGGDDGAAACTEALQRVGLTARRAAPVRTLSQGQRRRGALGRRARGGAARWVVEEPCHSHEARAPPGLRGL